MPPLHTCVTGRPCPALPPCAQASYVYDQFSAPDRTADGQRCRDACLSYLTADNQPCLAYLVSPSRHCYLLPFQLSYAGGQVAKEQLSCSL